MVQEVLRGLGKRRALLPMPVPLIKLVAGTAELLHLPFPVATDQLRQLKYDNTGALDSVRDGVRLRAAVDGRRPGVPAQQGRGIRSR